MQLYQSSTSCVFLILASIVWRRLASQVLEMWLDTASPLDLDLGLATGISSLAQRGGALRKNKSMPPPNGHREEGAAAPPLTWHSPRTWRVTKPTSPTRRRQISEWVMVRLCRSKARGLPKVDADRSPRGTREAPRPGGNGARMNSLIFPSPLDPLQTTSKWNLSGVAKWALQW